MRLRRVQRAANFPLAYPVMESSGHKNRRTHAEHPQGTPRHRSRRWPPGISYWARSVLSLLFAAAGCTQAESASSGAGQAKERTDAPASIEDRVQDWMDRAAASDPANSPPPPTADLVSHGSRIFQSIVNRRNSRASAHAAFALLQHPQPRELQEFWRAQLSHEDPKVRFCAVVALGSLADPSDLERLLRVFLSDPASHHPLAVHLRNWKDRRVVPALAEALYSADPLVAENAAGSLSLEMIPGVPVFHAEETGPKVHRPEGYWLIQKSHVPPYQRWWREQGKAEFASECETWNTFAGRPRPICMQHNE